jgi:hypothetical protein
MNQVDFFRSNPPRCLANFIVTPCELPGVEFDGHGEPLNSIFRVTCHCGSAKHFIVGYTWQNPDYGNRSVFLSPISLRCGSCARLTELIDTDIHGHDGEQGASCTARSEGRKEDFACPNCGPQTFEVFTRFEYPSVLVDSDDELYRGRESEFFSWFSLCGICSACNKFQDITDYECA